MEMNGKVVVVTGASMGIGEAVAKVFADAGASVVLLSRDVGRKVTCHRVGHTERTLALACDVRSRDEIDSAVAQTLGTFGRVDVWVSNAGIGIRDFVAGMDMAACRELFETNFFGAVACLQAVVPAMRKTGGGTIINISSVADMFQCRNMAIGNQVCAQRDQQGGAARVETRQHQRVDGLPRLCADEFWHASGHEQSRQRAAAIGKGDFSGAGGARDLNKGYRRQKTRSDCALDDDSDGEAVSVGAGAGGVAQPSRAASRGTALIITCTRHDW